MSEEPKEPTAEQKRTAEAMHLTALVLGYNELAKQAKTIGDKLYFKLFVAEYHKQLQEFADTGWVLNLVEEDPKAE
jgi:hypothetical protein